MRKNLKFVYRATMCMHLRINEIKNSYQYPKNQLLQYYYLHKFLTQNMLNPVIRNIKHVRNQDDNLKLKSVLSLGEQLDLTVTPYG